MGSPQKTKIAKRLKKANGHKKRKRIDLKKEKRGKERVKVVQVDSVLVNDRGFFVHIRFQSLKELFWRGATNLLHLEWTNNIFSIYLHNTCGRVYKETQFIYKENSLFT